MRSYTRFPLFASASLALTLLAGSAQAGPAQETVERMHQAAQKDDLEQLDQHVAYEAIAKASLADHWKDFSEAERDKFIANFREVVRRAYGKGLAGKKKQDLTFQGETQSSQGQIVHTKVKVKEGEPELGIDYLMACGGKTCHLVDVITDGSSLVASWKRMFRRIIKKHGKAELLARIEKKAAEKD